ncbi:MAG: HD domain-containing protein [archaeon]|nr:HD domain-containing protein [archaeon]
MGRMLNISLVYCFFDAANIHRWNDHLRPIDLTEIDKQAHKAAIAWILGKYEEHENRVEINWKGLIEDMMFSFLKRVVLTDLKPQVFHRIERERSEEINKYVLSEVKKEVLGVDPEFICRFATYLHSTNESVERRIVSAAHYLATKWEFDLIYEMNKHSFDIDHTKCELDRKIKEFSDVAGVNKVIKSKSKSFIDLVGQLRFQQRWTKVPRYPITTVLGHSLIVANTMFLHDLDSGAGDKQIYNDYFTALFHDLPEVLTKDVITPVKSIHGLEKILNEYEQELVNSKITPLIPEHCRSEFEFLIYNPFQNKCDEKFGPVNGMDIKLCDLLGAYMEAYASIRCGVYPSRLKKAKKFLRLRLEKEGESIDAAYLIHELENIEI